MRQNTHETNNVSTSPEQKDCLSSQKGANKRTIRNMTNTCWAMRWSELARNARKTRTNLIVCPTSFLRKDGPNAQETRQNTCGGDMSGISCEKVQRSRTVVAAAHFAPKWAAGRVGRAAKPCIHKSPSLRKYTCSRLWLNCSWGASSP